MLKDISKYKFYGRAQFVRLRGKYTHQSTHCAVEKSQKNAISVNLQVWGIFMYKEYSCHTKSCHN